MNKRRTRYDLMREEKQKYPELYKAKKVAASDKEKKSGKKDLKDLGAMTEALKLLAKNNVEIKK
jgi:hypothetical protein